MNLAGHRVRRLFGNYFEPCYVLSFTNSTYRARENTAYLGKYPLVLYVEPSTKVYEFTGRK